MILFQTKDKYQHQKRIKYNCTYVCNHKLYDNNSKTNSTILHLFKMKYFSVISITFKVVKNYVLGDTTTFTTKLICLICLKC